MIPSDASAFEEQEPAHGDEAVRAVRRVLWRERAFRIAAPVFDLGGPAQAWTEGALILLYHRIRDDRGHASDPFSVSRSAFGSHVAYLADHYRVVTVGEVARTVEEAGSLEGLAAISFDDGYDCTSQAAWPILRAHGVPATLFVDTGRLDGPRPALTRAELRTMAGEGLEVGSHTVSHVNATRVSDRELADELTRSARDLEEIVGHRPKGFAYPFGRYDGRASRLVREAGYDYACTCRQDRTNRPGDDPLLLSRVEVNRGDVGSRFVRKLRGSHAPLYRALYRLQPSLTGG